MQNTWLIGRSCKRREAFRRAVLIGRALAPILPAREGGAWNGWILRFGRHAALRVPGFRHAGESALHERDHRGGDHPIPFRTRQLSPPSPKVLQRQAAGGQGVALMQGASAYFQGLSALFLFRGPSGPFLRFWAKTAFRPFLVLWNWILFSLSESIGDDYGLGSA